MKKNNYIEKRPWGQFEILKQFKVSEKNGKDVTVKVHTVKPKVRLSYQSHKYRQEVWIFVQGRGIVVLNGRKRNVKAGDVIRVPKSAKHRFGNIDDRQNLVLLEVTLGHFDEDDIVRYQDDFGRVKKLTKMTKFK